MASQEGANGPSLEQITEAADRAGDAVREQISSIIEGAQAAADQIQQAAEAASTQTRAESSEAAAKVHSGLAAIEQELTELLRIVSLRARELEQQIDRFDARSDPGPTRPDSGTDQDGYADETSRVTLAPPPPEPEESSDSFADEAEADGEAEARQSPSADEPGIDLEAQAWQAAKGKDIAELVALYDDATCDHPLQQDHDGPDWSVYWTALHEAVIAEALAMDDLPVKLPDAYASSLNRRERRARMKALEALRAEVSSRRAS